MILAAGVAGSAGATDRGAAGARFGGAETRPGADIAVPAPMTMRMGQRLGPYRIGMRRELFDGLVRTIRQPRNDGYGCSGTFRQDSYIDVYPRLRLGYLSFGGRTYLDTISTRRAGDRSAVGLTIGRSALGDVRRRYPSVAVSHHRGGSTMTVYRRTGYEAHEYLTYVFDAARRLVGLETGVGGC